jgi:cell division septation protein DedD
MLRSGEKETEILLGNTQLLGVFFVVAILLGVAFYGGYVVGKGAAPKSATVPTATLPLPEETKAAPTPATGGETHSVPADSGSTNDTSTASAGAAPPPEEPPLGSRDRKNRTRTQADSGSEPAAVAEEPGSFTPRAGQTFLQVTAVGRDEAKGIADVLEKKGFRAHAVPKPGSAKLYRVIVGPIHDAGDLSSTRDSLRKTGFREVIVQRY